MTELERIEQEQRAMVAFACFALTHFVDELGYCKEELPSTFEWWCDIAGYDNTQFDAVVSTIRQVADSQ